MNTPYDDIINLPHHRSSTHPPMSNQARAAQFAPFAALVGYDEAVQETARLTDSQVDLSEDLSQALDQQLRKLQTAIAGKPRIAITYFVPDQCKTGGRYVTTTSWVTHIDSFKRFLRLEDNTEIPFDRIFSIEF